MPAQFWESHIGGPVGGAGAAYNTSVTLTDVSAAPQITLPANFLNYVGASLRLTAFGVFGTTVTPTLLLGFYYGGVAGVALAASAATATASGAVTCPYRMEATATVRTIGSAGTIMVNGVLFLGTTVALWGASPLPVTALATVTIDTTTAKAVTAGAQWGTSNASNTLTNHQMMCESVV